jgi:endonuclease YncB( thermonuclease family)
MKHLLRFAALFVLASTLMGQTTFPQTYYISVNSARARSCPESTCQRVTSFQRNTAITVNGTLEGSTVQGNNVWLAVDYNGQTLYVHSSLATTDSSTSLIATDTTLVGDVAVVTRIIDGDTIDVEINGAEFRVRYIGVNTTERGEPCSVEATAANAALVEGQTVTLVRDVSETDRYGRLLRYVYADGIFVNAELVAQGYAEAANYPPDSRYTDYFARLEQQTRAANLSCHALGAFGGGSISSTQQPQPTQQLISTPAAPAQGFTCSCSRTCTQMSSCEEAYFQLNQCGCGSRDGDGDGVPCESLCPGG